MFILARSPLHPPALPLPPHNSALYPDSCESSGFIANHCMQTRVMYSSNSYSYGGHHRDQSNDIHGRSFTHSHSQPFVVAGVSGQGAMHSPSLRSGSLGGVGGGSLSIAMADSLSQSRSHYQPGYLMASDNIKSCMRHDRNSLMSIISFSPHIKIT